MKNIFLIFIVCLILPSCTLYYGANYYNSKNAKQLYIGMDKKDAIKIMGDDYIIESVSQEEDGVLEIIYYAASSGVPYLLHFFDGKLVVFNRYYPPYEPKRVISIESEDKNAK